MSDIPCSYSVWSRKFLHEIENISIVTKYKRFQCFCISNRWDDMPMSCEHELASMYYEWLMSQIRTAMTMEDSWETSLPWEVVYFSSILVNLDAIPIKFALNEHFLSMKLKRDQNCRTEHKLQKHKHLGKNKIENHLHEKKKIKLSRLSRINNNTSSNKKNWYR